MRGTRISSGSKFEELAGYSRAVVDGDMVYVSGTTGFDYATGAISDDAAEQAEQCFRNIAAALTQAGCTLADMLRIRVILVDPQDFDAVVGIIGRHCRDARPANTTFIAGLVDPRMKVEIEVTARRSTGAEA